ncbi:hypothetical protein [Terribacillus saccharophilus]|uniref:hypothetical protein n=1 Tax=Terribacillus saccharophilus TaxID=361277 RepID=UPI003981CACA
MNNKNNSVSPSEMNINELPDVPALQDEFTRDFLSSMEQTKVGYYPLESGSQGFKMDFPEDMTIGKRSYDIAENNWSETMVLSYPNYDRNAFINMRINYYSSRFSVENSKDQMESSSERELDFKQIESQHKDQKLEAAEYENDSLSVIYALIWSSNGKIVQVHTKINCMEDVEEVCRVSKEEQKNKAMEMLKSIQLNRRE